MYNTHTMAESSFIRMPTFSRVEIISLAGYLIELFTDTVVSRWLLRLLLALRASIPGALCTKLQKISSDMPIQQTVNMLTRYHGGLRLG